MLERPQLRDSKKRFLSGKKSLITGEAGKFVGDYL